MSVVCPYCHHDAELVTGKAIYPHRPDLFHKWFWRCQPCRAWVGCHPKNPKDKTDNGTRPLGRLANAELRKAKQAAHSVFDPLWKSGTIPRAKAYKWLADTLGISRDNCHIGMMDVDGCKAVVAAVAGLAQLAKQACEAQESTSTAAAPINF